MNSDWGVSNQDAGSFPDDDPVSATDARLAKFREMHDRLVAISYQEQRGAIIRDCSKALLFLDLREALRPLDGLQAARGSVNVALEADVDYCLRVQLGGRLLACYCVCMDTARFGAYIQIGSSVTCNTVAEALSDVLDRVEREDGQ